ncbi:MAG: enolase C-terminal domain-like protein [Oligoflexus sp.]|jgi:o-succinylbenzoate synthase
MKLRLTWQTYTRPFLRPIRVKAETLSVRQGLWLMLTENESDRYLAECAPLTGWHAEKLSDIESKLNELAPNFESAQRHWDQWSWTEPYFGVLDLRELPFPSLQTAIEMLLLGEARRHRPDVFLLPPAQVAPESSVLVPDLSCLELTSLQLLQKQGVRTVKAKIGRQAWDQEARGLMVLRELFGHDLRLRLDFNRTLTGSDAERWLSFLRDWPIDYIEDPGTHAEKIPFAIALDEALQDRLPGLQASAVLVLKPNCFGLSRTIRWLQTGQRAVLSNTYESRLSLQVYLWIYSRFVARPEALGLGTVTALPADFGGSLVDEWGLVARWPEEPFLSLGAWPKELRR